MFLNTVNRQPSSSVTLWCNLLTGLRSHGSASICHCRSNESTRSSSPWTATKSGRWKSVLGYGDEHRRLGLCVCRLVRAVGPGASLGVIWYDSRERLNEWARRWCQVSEPATGKCRQIADILGGMVRDQTTPQIRPAFRPMDESARHQIRWHGVGQPSYNS